MWCDKCYGNYNAESKVKTWKLPRRPEERNRWITRPKDYSTNTGYVLVTYSMHLTALSEAYFTLFHLHLEKLVELIV